MERWEEQENREFIRAGTIAASIYNVNRDSQKYPNPITALDIFPHLPAPPPVPVTPEEAKRNLDRFFGNVTKLKDRGHLRRVKPQRSA